ncbi:MAG: GDP-mannose 4,6-dehydratase [Candidatus Omnitrophica bacterium]|nr:GDP-mannose 4,6-dehydratase [Candidatus Omnitrophota bacterium]
MDYANLYRNKKVIITGGLGFIGSNLARRLAGLGADITLVDSLIPSYGGNLYNIKDIESKVTVNIADVRDAFSMNYLIRGKDYLFNLAGTLSHIDSMEDPYTDLEINCRSQLSILEACRNNNSDIKIVFAGTRGQYGKVDYLPVNEKHLMHPSDINGINNIAGEMYHMLYNDIYSIRAVSLRLTNTYGPRHQMRHPRQGFLNWFIRLAIDDQTIEIYGDGKQLRDFNYADDVVEAILLAGANDKANGEVFNLGSGNPISVVDTAEKIIQLTGKGRYKFVLFPDDKKKIEVGDYYADYSKIKVLLGWEPKVNMKEGLMKTIDFYIKNKKYYWA